LAAKLVEIAERFKDLQTSALTQPGDDPRIASLKADAQKAIDAGSRQRIPAPHSMSPLLSAGARRDRYLWGGHDRLALNTSQIYLKFSASRLN
jgi:hypothetical protein